jgi:hypothetical protein
MIEVTVALPMLRARHIGWLALESLCRQKNLCDWVEWELLVAEETGPEYEPFGKENVLSYEDRLKRVNCRRMEYLGLDQWIPLSRKWKLLANRASGTSKIFVLQAADCYSQPYRIYETYQLFDEGTDWVQSPKGMFYSIPDEKTILYNHETLREYPCALNMALGTSLAKKLPNEDVAKGVDRWIFSKCAEIKGSELSIRWNENDTWKMGIDTNGLNTISRRIHNFMSLQPPFERCDFNVSDYLPPEVLSRLKECKAFCSSVSSIRVTDGETWQTSRLLKFNDLKVGQRVKVRSMPGGDGAFVALAIDLDLGQKAREDEAVIESLIQGIGHQKKTLHLLNREFALPNGIIIKNSQGNIISFEDLKVGDWAKLEGKYSARKGFVPEKIKVKVGKGFDIGKLQGKIDKIDQEKKTLELVGFTVKINYI